MNLQKEVFEAYLAHIKGHMEENRQGAFQVKDILERSPLNYKGIVEKTLQIPKIYSEDTIDKFREIAATTYRICGKVIREYRECEDYRELFAFPPELEELILLPMQYDGFLPIARFDLFYNEETGDFKFCEINTDGTASQLSDPEMRKALIGNPAHQEVIRHYRFRTFELFDSWVKAFMELSETYPKRKADPNIAIVDFLEFAILPDFQEYARRFQEAGFNCEICDVRSLTYRDGVLYSPAGNRIDAIYRRAVTADIMAHYDESSALLDCIRDDNVFVAGAFSTQILHTKRVFYVLHLDRTKRFLTEEERRFVEEHIPMTVEFAPGYITQEEVRRNKDHYVIKPMDAYASKGVYASGREYEQAQWDELTESLWDKGYICQEFCEQYLTENIDFACGDGEWHPYMNMPGLYMYNGVFSGFLMRMAKGEAIITTQGNERIVPVFVVEDKKTL